ncbi:amino acid adenylation domain-containing protein [Marinicella sp. W31]|uniref:amino acid adenylation domain-containing protein n=1 Tax=Marinicella sp. W31 TaxID=3023713 RepID=UPI0037583260
MKLIPVEGNPFDTTSKDDEAKFTLPVSWAQQRLWFLAQLEGGNAAYHIPGAVRLQGDLSRIALQQALATIVERHETLRTVFKEEDGEVLQEIISAEAAKFDLRYQDLRDIQNAESVLEREAEEFNQIPFDLAKGPLIRGQLIQLSDQEHVLLVTMHHIISDGWSMGVLIQEFNALYEAYLLNKPNPLPQLPIQYADYAVWQRNELGGDVLAQQIDYWEKHLDGVPELLNLPTNYERPTMPSYRGGVVDIKLDTHVSKQIRALALREGMTVHMVLHAVWVILLSRLSGQDQIVVGTPVANRQRHEVEGLIGFFVNTLALRADLSENPSVRDLLSHIKLVTLDGYANQDVPFEQVVELMQPERSLRYTPLFQVMFNFEQENAEEDLALSGVSSEATDLSGETIAKFDLTLSLSDDGEDIVGSFEYANDLFDHESVNRWTGYFSRLVAEFVSRLDTSVYELPMMSEAEHRYLLEDLNQGQAEYPDNAFIHTLFEERVKANPTAIALVYKNESLTYQQLNQRANQLAHHLIEQGIKPDTLVGLCLERSVDMVIGLLGILKAGGAYVPLDPHNPMARLTYQINDANLKVILTQETLHNQFEKLDIESLCLDAEDTQERLKACSIDNPECQQLGQHLAYAIYTSGTTGQPKGVMVEHQALTHFLYAMKDKLGDVLSPGSQLLAITTITFDIAGLELWGPLSQGGQIVLASRDDLLDPLNLISLLESHEIVCMQATPSTWQSMLDAGWSGQPGLSVLCGGEALPNSLAERLVRRCDRLFNCYGPTEATIWTLVKAVDSSADGSRLGGALNNYSHYVLDQYLQPVPEGVIGELFIGGAGLARGYLNQPELTAEKFIANPFYDADNPVSSERLYKTGDLVRWLADGHLEFLGRIDHQVKLRGFRIELGEIEAQLLRQADVREAVVILDRPDEENETGNVAGEGRLAAYVTTNFDSELEIEQLRQTLNESLPEYMVPSVYMKLDALPLTSSGKVDRKALPKLEGHHLSHTEYEAPCGATETVLAEIWQELLNIEQVSRHDSFFRLGGHSLLAIRLTSLVQQRLDRTLALQSIFERPVLKDLSQILDQAELTIQTPITLADRSKPLPLSWAQQRLWFIAQLEGGNAAYHIPGSVHLAGELSNDALNRALQTIVVRHEALRTVFKKVDGEVWQEIVAPEEVVFTLQFCDLRGVKDKDDRLLQEAEKEHQAAFNLAKGLLLRGRLVQLTDREHVLLITMHHIVSDGWSMGVLIQEFNVLYEVYCLNKPNPLPELPIQYADYAVWQRNELRGDMLTQQSEYWKTHLADVPELLNLPTDHPRPEMPSYRGGMVGVALDAQISERIRALALREGMTVHMVLHAIWVTLLSRLSGEDQIVVGTPVANRQRHEVVGLIGFFVNTLALRIDLSENFSGKDLLAQIKSVTLDSYANQDIPFEQVVELLQPERSLRYAPLFQVMFNFEQDSPDQDLTLSGLSSDEMDFNTNTVAQFDLTLSLSDDGQGIAGHLEYASDLFEHDTIERWSQYFSHLVTEFVSNVDAPAHELDILPIAERQQLLETYNDNTADLPSASTIHELFEAQVVQNPQAIALEAFGACLTYEVLNNRANQLAHQLIAQGVQSGDYAGLYLPRSLDVFVSMLAVMKAGGAYVMLDLEQPVERLQHIIEKTNMAVLLTDAERLSICDTHFATSTLCLDHPEVQEQLATRSTDNPDVSLKPNAPALVYFTSGSTGTPKGAINSHSGVINTMWAMSQELELTSSDRVLQFAALSFDVVIEEVFPAWFTGAAVVLRDEEGLLSPEQLQAMLRRLDISVCELMSSYWSLWVDYLTEKYEQPPECFRTVILGSDAVLMLAYNTWQAFDIPIVNVFGLTETGCTTLTYKVQGPQAYTTRLPNGGPLPNTKVYILDVAGNPVPEGVMGELCIGGAGVGLGYIGEPELTAERFVDNPFAKGTLYKTGDLARWLPGGLVEFIGRRDHQVKLRGFRIELGEIEAQLLNQDEVREAVVVLDESGETDRLVAYVTTNSDSELEIEQLRQGLNESLPEYMVPSIYVELEALPLTASGKVDRKALPKPDSSLLQAEYEPPVGETETALAEIWQELLNVEQVSRNDNFFSLGGHSLLIIRLIAELQTKNLHANIRTIFDHPILKDLAVAISQDNQSYYQAPANLIPADCTELTPDLLPLVDLEQCHIDSITSQVPGGVANIQDIYPLGPLQEGILFHHLLSSKEQGDSYVTPTLLSVPNSAYADRFIHALNILVARHDVLRTAVFWDDLPHPVQVVLRESPIVANTLTLDASQNVLMQLREHMAPGKLWMDLKEAPLLRLDKAADPESDQVFLILYEHHIINDHIGLEILIQEVEACLDAEEAGETLDLPPQTPYREFIAHTLMLTESGATQAYFESRLGDLDEPTLPFGLQDTQVDAADIEEFDHAFEYEFSAALRQVCSRLDISAASIFHLAWALVLGRCSGREDVVFGTVLSGRLQGTQGAARSVGLFINTLPLRLSLTGNVEDTLRQTHDELLSLLEHEQASLTLVRECTDLPSEAPLITSLLNYRRGNGEEAENNSRILSPENTEIIEQDASADDTTEVAVLDSYERTNYPLTLSVDDLGGEQFSLNLQAVAEIDGERVIEYMRTAMESLITAVFENDRSIKDIVILPKAERQQLLVELNQTQVGYPDAALIHSLFEEQVAMNPQGIALVYEDESLTYEALNQRSNQLAHYLMGEGVKPDTLVGLCIERSVEMIIAVLGILKAGGAYVPLDPTYPEARLAHQIEDANLSVILTQESLRNELSAQNLGGSFQTICLDADTVKKRLITYPNFNPVPEEQYLSASNLAYVIYTSGTTGQPKGVMIEHRSLCNLTVMQKASFNLSSACHVLQFASIAFDAATWEIFMALAQGGTLVMPSSTQVKSPEALSALVEHYQITHATLPPSLLPLLDIKRWAGVKTLIVAGEACAKQLAIAWSRDRQFVNAYGPSEFTVCATAGAFSPSQSILHMGKPNQNTQVYVCNDDGGLLPQGVPGELLLGGIGLARGYLNRPELTAEKFIANPFYDASNPASSERLYRTGDLVRWLPDGNLEFLGRIDHQVKLRGFRIELGEIEAQLLNQAEIHEAVVILDKTADRLVAYVVAGQGLEIDRELLSQALSDALPEYMVPSVYIELEALPLTSNGKVNRKALPKPEEHHLLSAEYAAPEGDTESVLAEIWQNLLDVEQVSRHDNFFSLGGHSLLAIRLMSLVEQRLERTLTLQNLFERPVLKDLSHALDQLKLSIQTPISMADRSQPLPLSWAQQRLWFIAQLEGGNAAYHIPGSVHLEGTLSTDALNHALDTIIVRHEALRTVFKEVNGEVWQEIIAPEDAAFNLQYCDLRGAENQESGLQQEAEAEHQTAFDLAKGPLIRGRLVQLADQEHVLLITMHHIVSDGWSMGVLAQEFNALYEACRLSKPNLLSELPIQYADYAVWQRKELSGDVLAQQGEYWKNHLTGVPEILSLPTDYARPQMPSYRGNIVEVALDAYVSQQIRGLALQEGMTVHMVLHAVWATLLSRLSGQDQIVVGTPVANRQRHELENLIGFFVNTLALRVDLSANPSVKNLLAQVKSVTLDGYAHQDIPFEQVVELVQPTRSLGHTPLFQTMFDFQHDRADAGLTLVGLSSEETDFGSEAVAKFDLTLSLSDNDECIVGGLEYACDLFDRNTVELWAQYFTRLVTEFVSQLNSPVSRLMMLSDAEQHYLLKEVNQTQADYPDTALIHDLFEDQVKSNPDAIAVVFEEKSLTYQALNQLANQLAHYLIEQGVKPDTLVGLCLDRSLDMVIGLLAILKSGGAYVPLDPTYPKARLDYMIEDAGLSLVLTQQQLQDSIFTIEHSGVKSLCLDDVKFIEHIATYPTTNPDAEALGFNARQLAYVIYTSGSTGQPKGVMIEHRSLCNLAVMQEKSFNLSSACHVLQFASIAFDAATLEVFMAFTQGGVLVIPNKAQAKSPEALSALVERHQVTHTLLPPSLLPLLDIEQWSAIKTLIVGGEACSQKIAALWAEGRQFVNAYGPSEITVYASAGAFRTSQSILHMGKPNQNTQMYVCDEHGVLLPKGVPGELLLGGVGLARGYLNRPELTAEKFIENPFYDSSNPGSSERLYKTGDLVRWLPDGNLEFLGRIDHQIKLRGFRIELGEIEAQLLNQGAVREAVVVLNKAVEEGITRHDRLVAYVTADEGAEINIENLRQALNETLPEYMVPAIYIELEMLPLTHNGKVDRQALPEPEKHHLMHAEYTAPQGAEEIAITSLCEDILGVNNISRHDNFFSVGGTSMAAIKLVSQLKERGYELSIMSLYMHEEIKDVAKTMHAFSKVLSAGSHEIEKNPVLLNRNTDKGSTPLFLLHEGSGETFYYRPLAKRLEKHFPVYGLTLVGTSINIENLSLQQLVSEYIKCIKKIQPQGPYRIAGWSDAGKLAYEMSNQLLANGDEIEFLGLLDSVRQEPSKEQGFADMTTYGYMSGDHDERIDFAKKYFNAEIDILPLLQVVKDFDRIPLFDSDATQEILASEPLSLLIDSLGRNRQLSRQRVIEKLNANHFVQSALDDYCMYKLPAEVSLFFTDETSGFVEDWRSFQGAALSAYPIPGNHDSMLTAPHVNVLAEKINHCFSELNEN